MERIPESRESLWLLITGPTIWAVHFLLCYISAAIWCAKFSGPEGSVDSIRIAIVVYTLLALAGLVATGLIGFRRHSFGRATVPHDFDTDADRHRFLGFASVLLTGLSAVAVLYVAMVAMFPGGCR